MVANLRDETKEGLAERTGAKLRPTLAEIRRATGIVVYCSLDERVVRMETLCKDKR